MHMRSKMAVRRLLAVAALGTMALWPADAMAGGGCRIPPTRGEGSVVAMEKLCFSPSVLHVAPGTEVTFVNRDPMLHNISATEFWSNGDMRNGDRVRATFEEEGIYPYACTLHFGMTGAVVVGDGDGSGNGVRVNAVPDASPAPEAVPASATTEPSSSPARPLAAGAAIGLVAGAGLGAGLRRWHTART